MTINPATARTASGIDDIDAVRDWIVVTVVTRLWTRSSAKAARAAVDGAGITWPLGAAGGDLVLAGAAGELDQVLVELEPHTVVGVHAR